MPRFLCALVACFAFACGGSDSPRTVFNATLKGSNETPPNSSTATGTAKFTLNPNNTITWTASSTPLAGRYSVSHIHLEVSPGVAGSPIVTTTSNLTQAADGSVSGGGTITAPDATAKNADGTTMTFDQLIAAMRAGTTYYNIHDTPTYSGGEIRGNLGP
jgi:hypothetical protein